VIDRDYLTVTVPAGQLLQSLWVLPGTSSLGLSAVSFIGVQAGPQVTVNPSAASAAALLGWWHYGENDVGTDILELMGTGAGAIGWFGPLPAGTYSFWIQDSGTGTASYRFEFGVAVVPEPASWALMLGGLAWLGSVAARRRVSRPRRGDG
jgi:hypothetical protein